MKKLIIKFVFLFICISLMSQNTFADTSIGVSVDENGIKGFYLSIGSHFDVQENNIIEVKKHSIPDEELVIVYFFAKHAKVEPKRVVNLRLKGKSWMEVSILLGLSTDIFYVKFEKDPGPPYGKAYGHYKNKPNKKKINKLTFSDAEIVNIFNLKFVSSVNGCSVEKVIKLRKQNKGFIAINSNFKHKKDQKKFANNSTDKNKSDKKNNNKKGKSKKK